jgi:hypothetical protein
VDTKGGAVTLTGTVPSEAVKTQAGEIAKAAKGVTSVNNNLTVGWPRRFLPASQSAQALWLLCWPSGYLAFGGFGMPG